MLGMLPEWMEWFHPCLRGPALLDTHFSIKRSLSPKLLGLKGVGLGAIGIDACAVQDFSLLCGLGRLGASGFRMMTRVILLCC